jgi:hypothetical protein
MPDDEKPKPKPSQGGNTISNETITKGDNTPKKTYEIKEG